ncbi:MAG: hypothetical protein ACFFG0_02880 [Candidatus Thorarchaeota archaeon]
MKTEKEILEDFCDRLKEIRLPIPLYWNELPNKHILYPWRNCKSNTKALVREIYNLILCRLENKIENLKNEVINNNQFNQSSGNCAHKSCGDCRESPAPVCSKGCGKKFERDGFEFFCSVGSDFVEDRLCPDCKGKGGKR